LLLLLADEPGRVALGDHVFFHDLVCLLEAAGHAVGVDAQGEDQRIVKDVVLEAELAIEDVPPAAPAVLDLFGAAEFTRLERVRGKLIEQLLLDELGHVLGFAQDLEAAERQGTGSKTHETTPRKNDYYRKSVDSRGRKQRGFRPRLLQDRN